MKSDKKVNPLKGMRGESMILADAEENTPGTLTLKQEQHLP